MGLGSREDRKAAWHLLQLAEQGRPVEVAAQFLASMWLCGGESFFYMLNDVKAIAARTEHLMRTPNQHEIWPWLMPGGSQGDPEFWDDHSPEEWTKLIEENRKLKELNESLTETVNDVKVAVVNHDLRQDIPF